MSQNSKKPLFDMGLLALRQQRALRLNVDGADFLLARAVDELIDRLEGVRREFPEKTALFCGTDLLQKRLGELDETGEVTRLERFKTAKSALNLPNSPLKLDKLSTNLVVSAFGLHWCNDLPDALFQIRQSLRPDGLFMGVLPGPGTLQELRDVLITAESLNASGVGLRIDPFTDMRDAGTLLQRAGFALPVVDVETLTVRYSSMRSLLLDLRHMGATCVLSQASNRGLTRTILEAAETLYREKYSDPDGRLRATFSLVFLSGWAPHPDQQKPLKPGSAAMRLEDALKVKPTDP